MPLKQDERRYAMKRVYEIYQARKEALREQCSKPVKAISDKEKRRQIQRGIASVKSGSWSLETPIGECFYYDGSTEETTELDSKAFYKAVAKLRKESAAVSDEIMLGDAEKAKSLLAKFEATVKV